MSRIILVPKYEIQTDDRRRGRTLYIKHYDDVIMGAIASQITSLMIVYSIVYSGTGQRKHQSSASLAFVREIHRGLVSSPHKGSVTRKMFPFDDVIMELDSVAGNIGIHVETSQWVNCQISKIAGCACTGNVGNVFPITVFKGNR